MQGADLQMTHHYQASPELQSPAGNVVRRSGEAASWTWFLLVWDLLWEHVDLIPTSWFSDGANKAADSD